MIKKSFIINKKQGQKEKALLIENNKITLTEITCY